MPSSRAKDFIKNFDLDKVFAVRLSRLTKNGRTQHTSTTTHHGGDHSVSADIPISINISSATSPRVDSSAARNASDMAQIFLPVVQAVAGAIPFAGPPMQATISGLLSILQTIDRRSQNKADLDRLASRLHRLNSHLCNAPAAQDPREQYRRDSIIRMLQNIHSQVTQLRNRGLAYTSATQAIIGCSSEIDRYLADYSWSSQMQSQHEIHEVLAILRRQQDSVGPTATQLTAAVTLGCVKLVDATGHEHAISVTFCTSYQQLNEMLQVLFKRDSIEAQLQRRYMEQGQYDLCIDDDRQVTRLTSQGWPNIEAGTTIVMRVLIEQEKDYGVDYKCHCCGAVNRIAISQADCSVNCRVCKRRFQISDKDYSAKPSTRSSNIDSVSRTEAEMHLIRNFHIQQTIEPFIPPLPDLPPDFIPPIPPFPPFIFIPPELLEESEFHSDSPTISPQRSHFSLLHNVEYGHSRIEEIEEDSSDDYGEQNGAEYSDDALPTDDEEWEDCDDGEAH